MTMVAGISLFLSLEQIAQALLALALATQGRQFSLQRNDLFSHLKDGCRPCNIDSQVVNQSLRPHEAVQVSL
jgi:hypothetical protein